MIITNHLSNKNQNQILLSIIFMIAASFSFACGSIATKVLGSSLFFESINPFQIVHARFFFSFIFLFFSEIFSNSNCKERKDSSSFSENFGKFIFSSRLVSSKKLSSSHFSIVAIFALLVVISLEAVRTASLKVSKNDTYSSNFKRSIKNFFLFVSVAVRNCKDALVF